MVQLLVCPLTKQPLTYDEQAGEFISKAAKLGYPVRGGVPILLPSEARSLDSLRADQEE
ncbi:MAG: Trm112 family protein [Pseudomonadota bacterium]